ncbi:hypothetical protein, partial [Kitasatospora sp. NPDC056731]|uniref:hypothetical protein n=1 Tax=Kitasatospora sp. NPDC056731 TaxID=3155422 RepID=UPI00341CE848
DATVTVEATARGAIVTTETATGRAVVTTRTVVTVAVEAATGGAVVTTGAATVVRPAPTGPGLVASAVVRSTLGTVLGLVRHRGDSFCCFSSTAD